MINPKVNRICAIRALREFTLETFGSMVGLREAANFVDVFNRGMENRRERDVQILKAALETIRRPSGQADAEAVMAFLESRVCGPERRF